MGRAIRSAAMSIAVISIGFATPLGARGATNGPITGGFTVTPISPGAVPTQLVTGTNGSVWFLTAHSQLGTVSPSGQATLTGVTFPSGATLVSAGPEGEWAFIDEGPFGSGPCSVALAEPDDHLLERTPGHPANAFCSGGARDNAGNLWVSLRSQGSNGMAEITPSGVITVIHAVVIGSVALGSDGAIWTFVRGFQFGRFVAGEAPTFSDVFARGTPPITGSSALGLRYDESQLLPRPDGTFWLSNYQAAVLSSPGDWYVRFQFGSEATESAVTSDGALWNVGVGPGETTERVQRLDAWGVIDRSAAVPVSPRNGTPLNATGPLTALPDGSLLFVATDGSANFIVHYVPTMIPAESVWTGSAGNGLWATAANWLNDAVPHDGSIVVLRGSDAMIDNIPGLVPAEILAYGTVHVSGDALSLGTYGIQVTGDPTDIVINDPISVAAGTTLMLRADPDTTLTLGGVISGAGGITTPFSEAYSTGLVQLAANNTYTGGTLVDAPLRIDGDQPGSAVDDEGDLFGGGTTGSVSVSAFSIIGFGEQDNEPVSYGLCPQTLTVDGNVVFASGSVFDPAIEACGTPAAQAIGSVKVTGTATIDAGATLGLQLGGDKPQLACLLSSDGSFSGEFAGVKQGSTERDPSGGKVVFSYDTPGGAGCSPNAFTAQTGVH
jgi:hypothetical protein